MREIRTSGLMSGDRKRSDATWPKPPRLSSTLLKPDHDAWGRGHRPPGQLQELQKEPLFNRSGTSRANANGVDVVFAPVVFAPCFPGPLVLCARLSHVPLAPPGFGLVVMQRRHTLRASDCPFV
jgi:hypothetical protein